MKQTSNRLTINRGRSRSLVENTAKSGRPHNINVGHYWGKMGAQLHVTKLVAAQRQLRAAIRMFFAGEDELAIHTVASAAYRIISDLKKKRGRDEVADYYLATIFYVVRNYRRGILPKQLTEDPEAMKWIQEMADEFPITASMKFEELRGSVSNETAREWWHKRNKVSNFLKHAEHDAKAHISLQEIDNLNLLSHALASYSDLVKDDLGAEGIILWIYFNIVTGTKEQLSDNYRKIANDLDEYEPDDQLRLCSSFIENLNQRNAQQPASQGFGPKSGPHL